MTQLTLSLKQDHKIQYHPSDKMVKDEKALVKQMETFAEHVTESGTVSYYAPSEELDCLPKALMICLFVARASLQHGGVPMIIVHGTPKPQTPDDSFDEFFSNTLGCDYDGIGGRISERARNRILGSTNLGLD